MKGKHGSNLTLPVLFLLLFFSFTAVLIIHYSSWNSLWQKIVGLMGLSSTLFLWIVILKKNELTLSFPLGGVFFILVPLINYLFWSGPLSSSLGIGSLLIVAGIILLENPYKEKEV